jgi:hypothetical protein
LLHPPAPTRAALDAALPAKIAIGAKLKKWDQKPAGE